MKMNDAKKEKQLESLAKSRDGDVVLDYVEELKSYIADIRQHPNVSGDIRFAIIEFLDEHLTNKINDYRVVYEPDKSEFI